MIKLRLRPRVLALAFGLIVILFLVPFQSTVRDWIGKSIVRNDPLHQADLVIVLGGDFFGPRVRRGAELVRMGYAPLALISGPVYGNQDFAYAPEGQLAIQMLVREGYPAKQFKSVSIRSGSTLGEVAELGSELIRYNAHSILLVTSNYHSRRACLAFFLQWPTVKCTCVGADDPVFRPERWWENRSHADIVGKEWLKYVGTMILRGPTLPFNWLDAQLR